MWSCEWCDYPNENQFSYTCEVCGEKSTFHTPPRPAPVITTPRAPENISDHKEYNRPIPKKNVEQKIDPTLEKGTIETALRVAQLLSIDVPKLHKSEKDQIKSTALPTNIIKLSDDKVIGPEAVDGKASPKFLPRTYPSKQSRSCDEKRGLSELDHICFMDPGNINCIICNEPMIFMMAAHLKYPNWLPSGINEKIEMFNDMITKQEFYRSIVAINGGAIPGMSMHMEFNLRISDVTGVFEEHEFPMNISITCSDWKTARYRGPTTCSFAAACNYAVANNRSVIIPVNILNALNEEFIHLLLITPPEKPNIPIGKIRIIDPKFHTASPIIESLISSIIDDIPMDVSTGIHWLFLEKDDWIQECSATARLMYTLTTPSTRIEWIRAMRFNRLLPLTVASALVSGMTLPGVLDMFVNFSSEQIIKFVEVALDRINTFIFSESE